MGRLNPPMVVATRARWMQPRANALARRQIVCRNIKPLFNFEPPASRNEMHDAALQFVRKISGYNKPSAANEAAFHEAVEEIEASVRRMLDRLETQAPKKDREIVAAKARERSKDRYARA
jgi:hypothetical protein